MIYAILAGWFVCFVACRVYITWRDWWSREPILDVAMALVVAACAPLVLAIFITLILEKWIVDDLPPPK